MFLNQVFNSFPTLKSIFWIITVSSIFQIICLVPHVKSTSMYYKKVQGEKYEPDWIAVSSTIIPLVERHTNVGVGFRVGSSTGSENNDGYEGVSTVDKYYKQAYVKHISKKYTKVGTAGAFVQPGTLITGKTTNSNKKDAH